MFVCAVNCRRHFEFIEVKMIWMRLFYAVFLGWCVVCVLMALGEGQGTSLIPVGSGNWTMNESQLGRSIHLFKKLQPGIWQWWRAREPHLFSIVHGYDLYLETKQLTHHSLHVPVNQQQGDFFNKWKGNYHPHSQHKSHNLLSCWVKDSVGVSQDQRRSERSKAFT